MFIKKMLMIIATFLTTLICFSLIFTLILHLGGGSSSFSVDDFLKLPLYIIGYGESPTVSQYIQLILCVAGIIMVNFLNAYLTVAIFRLRNVKVKPSFAGNGAGDFSVSFSVVNGGRQIYNASFTLLGYEQSGDSETPLGQLRFEQKLVGRRKSWSIRHKIEQGGLLYAFFHSHYYGSGDVKLQGILEYLDNDTGNQILLAKEFSPFDLFGKTDPGDFKAYIGLPSAALDLGKAKEISENGDRSAISLTVSEKDSKSVLAAELNFAQKGSTPAPKFLMALFENTPARDWSIFQRMGYRLEFDLRADASVSAVQLEVKSEGTRLIKVIDAAIPCTGEYARHSFLLRDCAEDPAAWQAVKEICLTCFHDGVSGESASWEMKNLCLTRA